MRWYSTSGVAAIAVALTACSPTPDAGTATTAGRRATVALRTADGKTVGDATIRESADGLVVSLTVAGMTPGMHGAHLHAVGKCDGPDFASAGPHWNPTGTKHGSMNPAGPHEGDLPNLMIGADGKGTLTYKVAGGRFDALLDADGAALVIHAAPDDLKTDPSGNSGGRIACGVLVAS
ncbi:MAG: superoxide dismutase family protein [Pseudomonadota bacterium]